MAICGWRTRVMVDRYDIRSEDDLREAATQVGVIRDSGKDPRDKEKATTISTK